ncbi:MAG: thioredoxin family protein [Conexivisphaera sp.]
MNPDEVSEFVRNRDYVVLDCWAPWCAPCHVLGAMLRDLAPKYPEITFARINVQRYPEFQERMEIFGLPTLLAWRKGKLVLRIPGVPDWRTLRSALDDLVTGE